MSVFTCSINARGHLTVTPQHTRWGKIKYPNTKIAISQKCLNISVPNFAHLFVTILYTNVLFCAVFTWHMSNWRKRKLQERISQLNKKLILLLKYRNWAASSLPPLFRRHCFSLTFHVIITVKPITLVMGKISYEDKARIVYVYFRHKNFNPLTWKLLINHDVFYRASAAYWRAILI